MEHESFENAGDRRADERALRLIKVDREERPDLDSHLHGGGAGDDRARRLADDRLPDAEGKPFFGGTYFPPEDRHGLPGFSRVLRSRWRAPTASSAREIDRAADELTEYLAERADLPGRSPTRWSPACSTARSTRWRASSTSTHGGLGGAPKFPQAMAWEFLLRYVPPHRRRAGCWRMVEHTLRQHGARRHLRPARRRLPPLLGRQRWLVPHFEKMLYDNALLSRALPARLPGHRRAVLPAHRRGDARLRAARDDQPGGRLLLDAGRRQRRRGGQVLRLDARRDRRRAGAGRGAWSRGLLRRDRRRATSRASNILNVPRPLDAVAAGAGPARRDGAGALAAARAALYRRRGRSASSRAATTKVLVSWNGLMLRSFAEAARVLGRADYRAVAAAQRRASCWARCAQRRPPAAHLQGRPGPHRRPSSKTTPSTPTGCWRSTRRPSTRSGSRAARELADAMLAHFADPARRLLRYRPPTASR